MEARTKTVEDWFAMIRDGQITLPRFQRFEAWDWSQIEGVLDSILRKSSLPIGALLVVEVGDKELFVSRPISGAPPPKGKPSMNLLDGQQRMTALWRTLTDNYEGFTVFVSLENKEFPEIEICRRHLSKSEKRMPLWADDPAETFKRKFFPVSLLCPGAEGEKAMLAWIEKAETDTTTTNFIVGLRHQLASYPLPFFSLPVDTEQETALDVFIKMNTSASSLKDFDIVVAQLEGESGNSLHEMMDDLHERVPRIRDYGAAEDIALAVGALLTGKRPLKSNYRDPNFCQELEDVWEKVVTGLSKGVAFLNDEMIFNKGLLPTEVIVYLTSALWANVPPNGTDEEGHARTQIRKTIWRASFTDRYHKHTTSRAFADYMKIVNLIKNSNLTERPDLFNDSKHALPAVGELLRGRWPRLKDRLGRAIMAVSLYGGGYDFADGAKATADNFRSREYHHIFPKRFINDRPDKIVNSALNCALISWKTNRKIAAKNPRQYIEERAAAAGATKTEVRQRLKSHLVPYDMILRNDFEAFIDARSKKIHSSMKKLCRGSVP